MRSVGMHGNKLILFIFSSNILQKPQEMGTFFISDFLQIMGHPTGTLYQRYNYSLGMSKEQFHNIKSISFTI